MRCTVQLFAGARDRIGRGSIEVELPEAADVAELRRRLVAEYPNLADVVPRAMLAVDAEYAKDDACLSPMSEIALIPPVSGG